MLMNKIARKDYICNTLSKNKKLEITYVNNLFITFVNAK